MIHVPNKANVPSIEAKKIPLLHAHVNLPYKPLGWMSVFSVPHEADLCPSVLHCSPLD